ncbi:MAG: PhzF family phenazine biosynthesis protein [Spirochaetota bacterium]|nr:MAG: PhzF family phenazine biosynthesis protein [Spirochaetota bacterium]
MRLYGVDAFTEAPFRGNPAAVCILKSPRNERWMQDIAAEMNLSETAFLSRKGERYSLRWFTPEIEVDLCGHATLASAHILWEIGEIGKERAIYFDTKSGELVAHPKGEWIELDFPAEPEAEASPPDILLKSLNTEALYVGKNRFDWLIEVDSEQRVKSMAPDFELLKKVPSRGVIVTSRSNSDDYDFVSRFFAPGAGINEDPVTGSAHSCLGPYWQKRLGKDELLAYQASKRGGFLKIRVGRDRVYISGKAVTVWKGEVCI